MSRIVIRLLALASLCVATAAGAEPLRVVTSTPDLADLARVVGGDEVTVQALVRGPQDAHFLDPRPTFVRKLHEADLYVEMGLQLEIGWSPVLLRSARNPKVRPGGGGYVDASQAIAPLEVPTGPVTRAEGDVHAYGNPHYLSDPLNGLLVARLLRDRLAAAHPDGAPDFAARTARFERTLLGHLVGDALAARTPADELVTALAEDRLTAWLEGQDGAPPLGGWLGRLASARGTAVVQDHNLWPYFARRFGLRSVAELEPLPGIAPTTAHLTKVVALMKSQDVRLLLASAYFDPRHARTVAGRTGIPVVTLAHQVGALPGADDYLSTAELNVRRVEEALRGD
ncbi:MAG: metal ABC transporter substrate-binding protein [Myxococcota bacterium]